MDEKQISELLECSVCLEQFDEDCKVLPCQHTFCRRCLDEILFTKFELRCPECRARVTTRVADLPTNILVVRILEGLKTKGIKSAASYNQGIATNSKALASSSTRRDSPALYGSRQGGQPCVKALYNYDSDVAGDLTFKKGDIINLKRQIDDNWFLGELAGVIGYFPANFVQILVPLSQMPQCKALYDFDLKDEGEKDCLVFKKDETLTVIRRVDENWIEGKKGDKIGIFPLVFVELNDAARILISTKPHRSTPQHVTPPVTSSATAASSSVTQPVVAGTSSAPSTPHRTISVPNGSSSSPANSSTHEHSALPQGLIDESSNGTNNGALSSERTITTSEYCPSSSESGSDPAHSTSDTVHDAAFSGNGSVNSTTTTSLATTTTSQSAVEVPSDNSQSSEQPQIPSKRHSQSPTLMSIPPPVSLTPSMPSTSAESLQHIGPSALEGFATGQEDAKQSSLPENFDSPGSKATSEAVADIHETELKVTTLSPKHKPPNSTSTAAASDSSMDSSTATASALTTPIYSAMYNYKPEKDDELELVKGDHYTVTEKCQDGWFKGACLRTGQAGVFPGNYVHLNRHSSAFKPVHPNVLNIRAKSPGVKTSGCTTSSVPANFSSAQETVTCSASTSSVPPPLLPRVAKITTQGHRSKSPSPALPPMRSMPHTANSPSALLTTASNLSSSGGRLHPPIPVMSKHASSSLSNASPSSHLAGVSVQPMSSSRPSAASSSSASVMSSSWSAQGQTSQLSMAGMAASASITPPPNVVMAPQCHSSLPLDKDKKEKKDKEKKGLVKLFGGKGKKSKQSAPPESPADSSSTMAVLCFDNVAHSRSKSHPVDSPSASGDVNTIHKKAASFDAASIATPPIPAKPRPKPAYRERYCCIVPYPPQTQHELTLELGDIIHVHRKRLDGWYKGTQERTGKTGLFPASFVEKM